MTKAVNAGLTLSEPRRLARPAPLGPAGASKLSRTHLGLITITAAYTVVPVNMSEPKVVCLCVRVAR